MAEDLLNIGFKKIGKRLDGLITTTDISLGYTEDDMEIKCISKLLCMLEILNLQVSIKLIICLKKRYCCFAVSVRYSYSNDLEVRLQRIVWGKS